MRGRAPLLLALLLSIGPASARAEPSLVTVGSKKFTESVLLGEVARLLARSAGSDAVHLRQLGGTRVLWNALRAGELDVYPEYTGTIRLELLAGQGELPIVEVRRELARQGVRMSAPLGFQNNYALGMLRETARSLGISTYSDLARHPDLPLGFTNEFMKRPDGWPGLRAAYAMPHRDVRGLDHDLAYRGLESGSIAVTDLYSTDAEIDYYDLFVLEDDRGHFPEYEAVLLYRTDLAERAPAVTRAFESMEGRVPEARMIAMNRAAKLDRVPESRVAADFVKDVFGLDVETGARGRGVELFGHAAAHLWLVGISLGLAIVVALPLGVWSARHERLGAIVLGVTGVVQTVPSLAMLVFMIPLLGIGAPPAIAALFLYSLLPIVRNTYTGLRDIPQELRESAEALGLSARARLRRVELPMASRAILAGIKTSAVINVGTATLGALIGAGGFGQPILTGIRLDDVGLILQGAVPAALLALIAQSAFDFAERWLVPLGLRLERGR